MKVIVVGDHPTLNEAQTGPFKNGNWRMFIAKMSVAGLPPFDCAFVNCISTPAGSMYQFTQRDRAGSSMMMRERTSWGYLRAEFDRDLAYLREYIMARSPNLVIACGAFAMQVLTGNTNIDQHRGRPTYATDHFGNVKVLPVYHPREIISDGTFEPVLDIDMRKAVRESESTRLSRPQRFIHIRPKIESLEEFFQQYIKGSNEPLSIDIETKGTMITCVGVAPSRDRAIVVPFFDEEKRSGNYWATNREELIAWEFIRRCCNHPEHRVIGQNLSFDVRQLLIRMGIAVSMWTDDTMILHHALQPELRKGLGFLGSLYTDELEWKMMHKGRSSRATDITED